MQKYLVNTAQLNVRITPTSSGPDNIISRLYKYRIVEVTNRTIPDWWEVEFKEGNNRVSGFVAARFLSPLSESPEILRGIEAVHLSQDPISNLNSTELLHKPMGISIPQRDINSIHSRIKSVHELVDILDVANSRRYRPTVKHTFCNIYAYDFCFFSQAYLPRVWWYESAIRRLTNQQEVEVNYGETVREMNANALHDWLLDWGDEFNWYRITAGVSVFQETINQNGGIGLICARRRDRSRSGHITVVLPETQRIRSRRIQGNIIAPLQSQAGAQNLKYFSNEKGAWWRHERYDSFVMFFHE